MNPVVKLTLDKPNTYGRAYPPGWAGDFLFSPPGQSCPWQMCGCEYLPSLKSIAPRGYPERRHMSLSGTLLPTETGDPPYTAWDVEAGLWDDRAVPDCHPRTRWLHMYSGAANVVGRVVSTQTFAPRLCVWIARHQPTLGTTLPSCDVSVKLKGLGQGYPSWRVVIPTRSEKTKGPYLNFDAISSGQAKEVSRFDQDSTAGLEGGWQVYILCMELTLNQWIMSLSIDGTPAPEPWVYTVPGTDVGNPHLHDGAGDPTPICGTGYVEVQTQGQQVYVAMAPFAYPLFAEAYLSSYFPLNSDLGDVTRSSSPIVAEAVIAAPTGTDAYVEVDKDGNSIAPRVSLGSTDNTTRPVCGVVGVSLPALIVDVDSDPWVSTAKKQLTGNITLVRRSTCRGNTLSATLRDPTAALTWKGNEVCIFEAEWQTTGAAPTLRKLFTGYVTGPSRRQDGGDPLEVSIEAADFVGSRMAKKKMVFTRSFGGMLFTDALNEIGNRLGFSADRILCTDAAGVYLQTPQVIGEQALYWGADDSPEEALDAICKEVSRQWGIDKDGCLFARTAPVYSTPTLVLDAADLEPEEYILAYEAQRNIEEFANNVYIITGGEGRRSIGWARTVGSETTDTDAAYVGDNLQYVETLESSYANAQTLATLTLGKRSTFQLQLTWRTFGGTLDPGNWVQVTNFGAQVPDDAVFLVVEARDEFELNAPTLAGWQTTYQMVRIQ